MRSTRSLPLARRGTPKISLHTLARSANRTPLGLLRNGSRSASTSTRQVGDMLDVEFAIAFELIPV